MEKTDQMELPNRYFIRGRRLYELDEDDCEIEIARFHTFLNRQANQKAVSDFAAAMNAHSPAEVALAAEVEGLRKALVDFCEIAQESKPNCGPKLRAMIQRAQEKHSSICAVTRTSLSQQKQEG